MSDTEHRLRDGLAEVAPVTTAPAEPGSVGVLTWKECEHIFASGNHRGGTSLVEAGARAQHERDLANMAPLLALVEMVGSHGEDVPAEVEDLLPAARVALGLSACLGQEPVDIGGPDCEPGKHQPGCRHAPPPAEPGEVTDARIAELLDDHEEPMTRGESNALLREVQRCRTAPTPAPIAVDREALGRMWSEGDDRVRAKNSRGSTEEWLTAQQDEGVRLFVLGAEAAFAAVAAQLSPVGDDAIAEARKALRVQAVAPERPQPYVESPARIAKLTADAAEARAELVAAGQAMGLYDKDGVAYSSGIPLAEAARLQGKCLEGTKADLAAATQRAEEYRRNWDNAASERDSIRAERDTLRRSPVPEAVRAFVKLARLTLRGSTVEVHEYRAGLEAAEAALAPAQVAAVPACGAENGAPVCILGVGHKRSPHRDVDGAEWPVAAVAEAGEVPAPPTWMRDVARQGIPGEQLLAGALEHIVALSDYLQARDAGRGSRS